jgi:DNA-binding NarL/FixJ family response regulator
MQRNRPHIVIADDHTFMADACKKLLEPKYDVVATVGDGRALVRIAATLKPQVIIISQIVRRLLLLASLDRLARDGFVGVSGEKGGNPEDATDASHLNGQPLARHGGMGY